MKDSAFPMAHALFMLFVSAIVIGLGLCVIVDMSTITIIDDVYEEHCIQNIEFKELTGSYQMPGFTIAKYKYDVTIESGEIFSTNIDSLNIGKKYTMRIFTVNDDKMSRILRDVVEISDVSCDVL